MTVTAAQIKKVKDAGFDNVEAIAQACNVTKCPFYLAVAMFEKESHGRNVYGGDSGGALRGFEGGVTKGNYAVFRWMIDEGIPVRQPDGSHKIIKFGPNGVGPGQITHPDLVAEMKDKGLEITDAEENILFSAGRIYRYYLKGRETLGVRDSIKYAGTRYNGKSSYGDDLLEVALRWKESLGSADYISRG